MTNVLPPEVKRDIRRFYRRHLVIVASLVALASAFIAGLALLPSYFIAESPSIVSAAQIKISTSENRGEQAELQRVKRLLHDLEALSATTTPALDGVKRALALRPSGIVLTNISYDGPSIQLQGSGPSRDVINSYAIALRAEPAFKQVSVPLGALTGAGESTFNITISGSF